MSRRQATKVLAQKLAAASTDRPTRSLVTLGAIAAQWTETVLPTYKQSTQKHRRYMLRKQLSPTLH
jgi:hypothetical protein